MQKYPNVRLYGLSLIPAARATCDYGLSVMDFTARTEEEKDEADDLIRQLYKESGSVNKKRKNIRHTDHKFRQTDIVITSWKFNEWEYKKDPPPFPTLARGLFTIPTGKRYDIAIRGYDKFFNIGEVKKTQWPWIEANTSGPYEVTLKENGCILFITGLASGDLLVTSKHSMGEREGEVAHAVKGEEWVEKHLEKVGKQPRDLASFLYRFGLTAVGELCDDLFEEHVLAYTDERRGVYLHGLNRNTAILTTYPSEIVHSFAQDWGFHTTKYIKFDKLSSVKAFTDRVRDEGEYEGLPIEGFVVRSKVQGIDFFFKVKYDEPYLMYREWREITKAILAGKENPRASRKESKVYSSWVKEEIKKHPKDFADYAKGRGIISIRERFLKWYQMDCQKTDGQKISSIVTPGGTSPSDDFTKTLLVPIATPGCGKTSVALVLTRLFGFGHIQNDNITVKKGAPKVFIAEIKKALKQTDVVIADKNNHEFQHRSLILPAIKKEFAHCRFVAMYFPHEEPLSEVFAITNRRVKERGDNHQSLTPVNPDLDNIMWRFLKAFDPLDSNSGDDGLFDEVIQLPIANSIEANVKICIDRLVPLLGLKRPTDQNVTEALAILDDYKPSIRKVVNAAKEKPKAARYYGIELTLDTPDLLHRLQKAQGHVQNQNTVVPSFPTERYRQDLHITMIHTKEVYPNGPNDKPDKPKLEIWNSLKDLQDVKVIVHCDSLVFDHRIAALSVHEITSDGKEIPHIAHRRLHITLGTLNDDVNPYEANALIERAGKDENVHVVDVSKLIGEIKGRIHGFIA